MVIGDFLKAIKEGRRVVLEDPMGGSKFLDPSKRLMNTYIVHTAVDDEGNNIIDISKVRKFSIVTNDNGTNVVSFDDKVFVPFDMENHIVVLKKINIITDDLFKIMSEKHNMKSRDRVEIANIYECGVIDMQSITPNVAANKYPYIYSITQFINDRYVTEVSILYNNDTLIPRLLCSDEDPVYIKSVIQCMNYITKIIDSEAASYLFNGEYFRTKDSVIKLVDIDNGGFIFKNIVTGEIINIGAADAGSIIIRSKVMSNKFICVEMNKENEYLFYYNFANKDKKKDYNKEKLLEIYNDILKEHNVEDSPLCIMYEDIDAIYTSVNDIKQLLEEDINDEEEIEKDE